MTEENLYESQPSPESTPEPVSVPEPVSTPEPVIVPASEPAPTAATTPVPIPAPEEPTESFADALKDYERTHKRRPEPGTPQIQGTVVSITAEEVFLDVGYKIEGALLRTAFDHNADNIKVGDLVPVSITGRNEAGYYQLSLFKIAQPTDWSTLQAAFDNKLAIPGTVIAINKGGLTVDIGIRAFMPASRTGVRDAAEMEKLVGTEITCRITKLDIEEEDAVVDRRGILEEQAKADETARRATLKEGDTLTGTVRSLAPYGAFVDLGGFDGLLHISDIAYSRVNKPEDVLSVGQQLQVRLLKLDNETGKISLGLKQLQPEPWETAPERYQSDQRVSGTVTRLAEYGAFIELEPGVEGMVHISEMAWNKKVRHPSDLLKVGDRVDAVVLAIKPEERRISLGLKQTLADPWIEVQRNYPVGSQVQGAVARITAFGAFVQIAEGIEGLVHISEIVADRRLNHPSEVLRVGEVVKAQVLAIDSEKRQVKLSMKQLIPTSLDEYITEHTVGDKVSGRVVEHDSKITLIELGEGVRAICNANDAPQAATAEPTSAASKLDLSSLSSMLKDRWKGNTPDVAAKPGALAAGQIRSFKITKLDLDAKKIEVELA